MTPAYLYLELLDDFNMNIRTKYMPPTPKDTVSTLPGVASHHLLPFTMKEAFIDRQLARSW